jgi:hypothetical protein
MVDWMDGYVVPVNIGGHSVFLVKFSDIWDLFLCSLLFWCLVSGIHVDGCVIGEYTRSTLLVFVVGRW